VVHIMVSQKKGWYIFDLRCNIILTLSCCGIFIRENTLTNAKHTLYIFSFVWSNNVFRSRKLMSRNTRCTSWTFCISVLCHYICSGMQSNVRDIKCAHFYNLFMYSLRVFAVAKQPLRLSVHMEHLDYHQLDFHKI